MPWTQLLPSLALCAFVALSGIAGLGVRRRLHALGAEVARLTGETRALQDAADERLTQVQAETLDRAKRACVDAARALEAQDDVRAAARQAGEEARRAGEEARRAHEAAQTAGASAERSRVRADEARLAAESAESGAARAAFEATCVRVAAERQEQAVRAAFAVLA
jgi:hypothetical protein